MMGISERPGMVQMGSSETAPALLNPSPRTMLSPMPRKLTARPLTT